MIYPSTATLAGNGTGTASLTTATVGGFGLDFGLSFGGPTVMGPVTATLYASPGSVGLGGGAVVTATLAGNGISTAALVEVTETAELQLV